MIKLLQVTVQYAPLESDPKEYIMDVTARYDNGDVRHGSWNSVSLEGCLHGLPLVIERLNNQETYA